MLRNIKEWKNFTCFFVWVVIVKWWFSVLSNLKSHTITYPRVTNNDAPSYLWKTLNCTVKIKFLLLSNQRWLLWVSTGNHYVPLCTLCTPSKLVSLLWPFSFETIIHMRTGVAPQNMPQTSHPYYHPPNELLLGVPNVNKVYTIINFNVLKLSTTQKGCNISMGTKDNQWWTFEVLRLSTTQNGCSTSKYASNFKLPIITHSMNGC